MTSDQEVAMERRWALRKGTEVAAFGALAVVNVQERQAVGLVRDRGGDAAVHAAAYQDDCQILLHSVNLPIIEGKFQFFSHDRIRQTWTTPSWPPLGTKSRRLRRGEVWMGVFRRSAEHTSELQSPKDLV